MRYGARRAERRLSEERVYDRCARPCAVRAAKDRVGRALPGTDDLDTASLPPGTSACVIRVSLDGMNDAVGGRLTCQTLELAYRVCSVGALTDIH